MGLYGILFGLRAVHTGRRNHASRSARIRQRPLCPPRHAHTIATLHDFDFCLTPVRGETGARPVALSRVTLPTHTRAFARTHAQGSATHPPPLPGPVGRASAQIASQRRRRRRSPTREVSQQASAFQPWRCKGALPAQIARRQCDSTVFITFMYRRIPLPSFRPAKI
jgi:hypothetical protein